MRVVILIIFFLISSTIDAQIKWSDFDVATYYSKEDGLFSGSTWNLGEDKDGFLWITTQNGISRFDGSTFTNYTQYIENFVEKKIGKVNDVAFDEINDHIIIISDNGVFLSKRKEIQFKPINEAYPSLPNEFKNGFTLYVDKERVLWIGTNDNGLVKIDLVNQNYQQFWMENKTLSNQDSIMLNKINKIIPDNIDNNILWIGTTQGLIKFNKITNAHQIYYYQGSKDYLENNIWHITLTNNSIFVGTANNNWFGFNRTDYSTFQPIKKGDPFYFYGIRAMYLDDNSHLWVTSDIGMIEFNTKTNKVLNGVFNNYREQKFSGVKFIDSRKIIWCTSDIGLFKYETENGIKYIELVPDKDFAYPAKPVSIIKNNDQLIIATNNGDGIYKLNINNWSYSIIPIPLLPYDSSRGYLIQDMIEMNKDSLLILGNKKALIFNIDDEMFSDPPIQILENPVIYLRSLTKDLNNNYWIATNQDGLYKLNFEHLTFDKYVDLFKGKNPSNHLNLKKLFVDSKNNLWIGQTSPSILNINQMELTSYKSEFEYDNSIGFGDFLETKGKVWVANIINGITYIDNTDYSKDPVKVLDGSFSGLYKYNDSLIFTIEDKDFSISKKTYPLGVLNVNTLDHKKLKLETKTIITGPIEQINKNQFVIGCENGVIVYNHENQIKTQELPKVYIQEIKANNELSNNGTNFDNNDLIFPSGTKSLSIKISALAFRNPDQVSYQYKIDDNWFNIEGNKDILLSNLSQGDFKFELKAINGLGNGLEPLKFTFKVKPYWYTSNLALLLFILFCGSIVYALYKFNLGRNLALVQSKKAKEINEIKSKMFANISHEFKTPLTIIKGLSNQLLKKSQGTQKEWIKGIDQSNDQLLNLVNQLLDLAALDAQKMEVQYKNGDIINFIKKCVSLYKSYSDSKLQNLEFSSSDKEIMMDFDDDKLQKILNNLLSNAIKFTPKGGKVKVELLHVEDQLRILISDNGQGINEANIQKVFERYFTTESTINSRGSGIGLSHTRELVNLLGGSISVYSKEGQETVFTVNLPITNESVNTEVNHSLPFIEKIAMPSFDSIENSSKEDLKTVLLVEDNTDIQKFIFFLLSSDYNVIIANNGFEALNLAQNNNIDFIISDVMMPKMDGVEFCKQIKNNINTSHIPFIMLSAKSNIEDKLRTYDLGIDAYITKPFNPEELKLIIKNLITKQVNQKEHLLKLLDLKTPEVKNSNINSIDLNFIHQLQIFIFENNSKLSANVIARQFLISRTQLHRKIKSLTGKSLTNYANHIKIEKAKHLLNTTELQVKEIAYSLGYESSTYFIRLFKRKVGLSPEVFRNKN